MSPKPGTSAPAKSSNHGLHTGRGRGYERPTAATARAHAAVNKRINVGTIASHSKTPPDVTSSALAKVERVANSVASATADPDPTRAHAMRLRPVIRQRIVTGPKTYAAIRGFHRRSREFDRVGRPPGPDRPVKPGSGPSRFVPSCELMTHTFDDPCDTGLSFEVHGRATNKHWKQRGVRRGWDDGRTCNSCARPFRRFSRTTGCVGADPAVRSAIASRGLNERVDIVAKHSAQPEKHVATVARLVHYRSMRSASTILTLALWTRGTAAAPAVFANIGRRPSTTRSC